jgi:hypothetical protein
MNILTNLLTAVSSATSRTWYTAFPPFCRIPFNTVDNFSCLSTRIMVAPCAASISAVTSQIPSAAPVTIANCPANLSGQSLGCGFIDVAFFERR